MTEKEAKSKWCPFARIALAANTSGDFEYISNRPMRDPHNCIVSACMAWRRSIVMVDRATGKPAVLGVASTGQLEPRYSDDGFCGLARNP